jgi:glycosyltransferase 2 family protein
MSEIQSNNKLIKILKKILPLIGIGIFVYLIISIEPSKILSTFLEIPSYIFILIVIFIIIRILLNNYIWLLILKKQKISISYFKSLKILLIGNFYAYITPGGFGTYARVLYLKEETKEPTGKLFINLFSKSALDALSYYFIIIIAAIFYVDQYPVIFLIILVYIIFSTFIFLFFVKKERGEKTFDWLIKYFVPKRLKEYLTRFSKTFYYDFPRIQDFIIPFILCIFVQIITYSQFYIIALSLGIEIPFNIFIVLYIISNIIALIPISIGGLGTREAALILLFTPYGVAADKIVVLSLSNYILSGLLLGLSGFILSLMYASSNKKLLKQS